MWIAEVLPQDKERIVREKQGKGRKVAMIGDGCPIIREADGLAKSSRNTYLSAEERKAALVLSRAVKLGQELVRNGEKNADAIVNAMRALIEQEPLARIDYVSAVDGLTMLPVHEINGGELIAMAVYIGKTRLIDNFSVEG